MGEPAAMVHRGGAECGGGACDMPPRFSLATPAVRSAAVLALALLGDALLYLVLPVHAVAFGLSPLWVGVLLSANRLVRIGLNGLLVPLSRRVGLGRLTLLGAVTALLSTSGYAILSGGAALLAMRLMWGFSFSALRLSVQGYATERPRHASRLLGWSHALSQTGPLLAVTLGAGLASRHDPRAAFGVMAAITATGVVLARRLPHGTRIDAAPNRRRILPRPNRIDAAAFLSAIATDGIFMTTASVLLVQQGYTTGTAVQLGGLILLGRRAASIAIGPIAGRAAERWGLGRLFCTGLAAQGIGLLIVALGFGLSGLIVLALLMSVAQALTPGVAAAARPPAQRIHALASVATWTDVGAAAGAFLGGALAADVDLRLLYAAGGALVGVALLVQIQHPRSRMELEETTAR